MRKIILLLACLSLACFAPVMGAITATATSTSATSAPITSAPVKYDPSPTGTQEPACVVTVKSLNVRKEPNADVIAYLFTGEIVTILEDAPRGAWIKVSAGNVTGWIHSKYCTRKK